MNSQPTPASVMTGFIVGQDRLYAALQEPNGETSLYDKSSSNLAHQRSSKNRHPGAEYRACATGIDDRQHLLAVYRCSGTEINNPYGNTLPVMGGA